MDLLKVGHHCLQGSSTKTFIETLRPHIFVITNDKQVVDSAKPAEPVKTCRRKNAYITGNENGVLAVIGDDGAVACCGDICG